MTEREVTIDDLGAQGDGIAHDAQGTLFVGGALKGERVRIELEQTRNNLRRGTIKEILTASPDRQAPACPHFPECGGCRFQHMTDQAYSKFKAEQLANLFARNDLDASVILPIFTTPRASRRRARLAVRRTREKTIIGFNAARSHAIVEIKECCILSPVLLSCVEKLRAHLSLWLPVGGECDAQITVLPEGVDVVLIGGPKLDLNARQDLAALAQELNVAHLTWRQSDRSGDEPIAHRAPLSVSFPRQSVPFPPAAFLQATSEGENALTAFAAQSCRAGDKVLDLFCGLGTFGLSMLPASKIHFVDLDGPSVAALDKALKATGSAKLTVDQRNLIRDPISAGEVADYDLVIFDPPRGGAKAQAERIADSGVSRVIAISCDPAAFVRDAKILIEAGYEMESVQPVDQFLWSDHLEIAARFVR